MNSIAIYPGTFNPITHGHTDIIKRAAGLFEQLVVAVAESTEKQPELPLNKRVNLAKSVLKDLKNVEVCSFSGLTVHLARKYHARIIIRGVRSGTDLDYELQLAGMNQRMAPDIETIFFAPAEAYRFISASIIREIIAMGGDVSAFVDNKVEKALREVILVANGF